MFDTGWGRFVMLDIDCRVVIAGEGALCFGYRLQSEYCWRWFVMLETDLIRFVMSDTCRRRFVAVLRIRADFFRIRIRGSGFKISDPDPDPDPDP